MQWNGRRRRPLEISCRRRTLKSFEVRPAEAVHDALVQIGRAREYQIHADGLERFSEVDTVVVDKTGPLTRGEPSLANAGARVDASLAAAASLGDAASES